MKTGIQKNIQIALNAHLDSLTNAPLILWPNKEDEEIANASVYFTPHILFATTQRNDMDGKDQYTGFYQVDVYVELDKGEGELVQWLDSLSDHFRANSTLSSGGIVVCVDTAERGGGDRVDNLYWGFVQINFNCFA